MRPLTARTWPPGSRLFSGGRLRSVPANYVAAACEGCEWFVRVPERMGRDFIERLRRQHIDRCHATDVLCGRMVINVEMTEAFDSFAERVRVA